MSIVKNFCLAILTASSAVAFGQDLNSNVVYQANQTTGCKKTNGVKSDLEVDFVTAIRLMYADRRIPFYIAPDGLICLKHKEMHRLVMYESKQHIGDLEIRLVKRPVTLGRFWADINLVAKDYPGMMDYAPLVRNHFEIYYPQLTPDDYVIGLELGAIKRTDNFINPYSYIVPPASRFAETIDYAAAAKMVTTEKPFILDTRNAKFFDWWHLPGANNFQVATRPVIADSPFIYNRFWDIQADIPLDKLPKDKKTKILVLGYSVTDWSGFFTLHYLRVAGFQNVFWYRGGQEDWHQIRRVLPDGKAPGVVSKIKWTNLEKNRKSYVLIDTRKATDFSERHVVDSISIPYTTSRMPPRNDGDYSQETFAGDQWDESLLPKEKTKTLVIVGNDESDWSAVIATRKAMQLGYKALWYQGGAAEWNALNRWYGTKFSVSKPFEPGQ